MSNQIPITVYVDLAEIDTDDLIEELKNRDHDLGNPALEILRQIFQLRRTGQPYEALLDKFIMDTLGVIL